MFENYVFFILKLFYFSIWNGTYTLSLENFLVHYFSINIYVFHSSIPLFFYGCSSSIAEAVFDVVSLVFYKAHIHSNWNLKKIQRSISNSQRSTNLIAIYKYFSFSAILI